jgi:prolyl-tRNA editing enzyme YbaK/EbsC (Cys-tRNA(Pro) deacylase)
MKIQKSILNYLEKENYKYEIIEHKTTYTAWDTAQTKKVKPQEVAKTLVLKLDKALIAVVLPANRNIDKKKLLAIYNTWAKKNELKSAKKLEFAKEAWMKKNVPGKLGAVPPFRGVLKVEIFMDKLLAKNKRIFVGSGIYEASFRVNVKEYIKKEQPILASFSVKK